MIEQQRKVYLLCLLKLELLFSPGSLLFFLLSSSCVILFQMTDNTGELQRVTFCHCHRAFHTHSPTSFSLVLLSLCPIALVTRALAKMKEILASETLMLKTEALLARATPVPASVRDCYQSPYVTRQISIVPLS